MQSRIALHSLEVRGLSEVVDVVAAMRGHVVVWRRDLVDR